MNFPPISFTHTTLSVVFSLILKHVNEAFECSLCMLVFHLMLSPVVAICFLVFITQQKKPSLPHVPCICELSKFSEQRDMDVTRWGRLPAAKGYFCDAADKCAAFCVNYTDCALNNCSNVTSQPRLCPAGYFCPNGTRLAVQHPCPALPHAKKECQILSDGWQTYNFFLQFDAVSFCSFFTTILQMLHKALRSPQLHLGIIRFGAGVFNLPRVVWLVSF